MFDCLWNIALFYFSIATVSFLKFVLMILRYFVYLLAAWKFPSHPKPFKKNKKFFWIDTRSPKAVPGSPLQFLAPHAICLTTSAYWPEVIFKIKFLSILIGFTLTSEHYTSLSNIPHIDEQHTARWFIFAKFAISLLMFVISYLNSY